MGTATERGTLAGLIERLADGVDRLDASFARRLAAALHDRAAHLTLPEVEALGLRDVMVTFYMDREMRLVVTGGTGDSGAEVSVRWREADFGRLLVDVHAGSRPSPYLFATLDFSVRGQRAVLQAPTGPLAAGLEVTLRCLSTVGDEVSLRVSAQGEEVSVSPDLLVRVTTST